MAHTVAKSRGRLAWMWDDHIKFYNTHRLVESRLALNKHKLN